MFNMRTVICSFSWTQKKKKKSSIFQCRFPFWKKFLTNKITFFTSNFLKEHLKFYLKNPYICRLSWKTNKLKNIAENDLQAFLSSRKIRAPKIWCFSFLINPFVSQRTRINNIATSCDFSIGDPKSTPTNETPSHFCQPPFYLVCLNKIVEKDGKLFCFYLFELINNEDY